jgi:hypothetical protein
MVRCVYAKLDAVGCFEGRQNNDDGWMSNDVWDPPFKNILKTTIDRHASSAGYIAPDDKRR